jgi:hypothetical protein
MSSYFPGPLHSPSKLISALATADIPNDIILFHTRVLAFQTSIVCIMLMVSIITTTHIANEINYRISRKLSSRLLLSVDHMYKLTVSTSFFRNVCNHPPDYMTSRLSRLQFWCSLLWELPVLTGKFVSEIKKSWKVGAVGEGKSIVLNYGFSPSIHIVFSIFFRYFSFLNIKIIIFLF